jgi:predicted dehydrogenase
MRLQSVRSRACFGIILGLTLILFAAGCTRPEKETARKKDGLHRFMVLDPGHFHAALVFKRPSYQGVSPEVGIYATVGEDFIGHMSRVAPFNNRADNPADWRYRVYLGPDPQQRMIDEQYGDIVVLSGQNDRKIDRILASVKAGINVLSDKPLLIDPEKFPLLEEALAVAESKGVVALDIMTERHEITTTLQRMFLNHEPLFGEITKGTPEDPAVVKKSVHNFYKQVAGKDLVRPWWYFDTSVQGEGIVDVTTHLVDIIFWILRPGQAVDYKKDIEMISAEHWPTVVTPEQFSRVTGKPGFPDQLVLEQDGSLACYSNGRMNFLLGKTNVQLEVIWNYQAPKGAGDTHYSIMKGSRAHLLVLQGAEQNYKPELYVVPAPGVKAAEVGKELKSFIENTVVGVFPGVSVAEENGRWRIEIPQKYKVGHEAHFGQVTDSFLRYLDGEPIPDWERPNMLAKYYVTTSALKLCRARR